MFRKSDFEKARETVYAHMQPTLQYSWPLICQLTGCETWVKHENHTPIGAFKVRGGIVHMHRRKQAGLSGGVITATRGNHGQSIPFGARLVGIATTIVVPEGNSVEKNNAIRALGAELIEAGKDFNVAAETAQDIARARGLDMLPSYHADLVMGVSTYAHELFDEAGELDAVFVPIGMGSGISGLISARDMLGLKTEIFGVVSENANAYALSFEAGKPVNTHSAATFADGMAVRVAHHDAVAYINKGAAGIVTVSETEVAEAIRIYYRTIHNIAEGAGAASLAGLLQQRDNWKGKRVGVILSGGNIDTDKYLTVLSGGVPAP
jgi:threonine dehydratase